MRAVCAVLKATLSSGDIIANEELTLRGGFARGDEASDVAPHPGIGIIEGRTER
jgi:hypothetical protein